MATAAAGVSEAATDINILLGLYNSDQEALLEVIHDYFTSPVGKPQINRMT